VAEKRSQAKGRYQPGKRQPGQPKGKKAPIVVLVSAACLIVLFAVLALAIKIGLPPESQMPVGSADVAQPNATQADGGQDNTLADNFSQIDGMQQPSTESYLGIYYSKVTFKASNEVHGSDGTGSADVTVTTPDMKAVFATLYSFMQDDPDSFTAETAEENIKSSLSDDNCPTTTTQVSVSLKEVDGEWKIVPNDDFYKAITCDTETIMKGYYAQISEDELTK